jgi:hypothetical protein
MSIGGGRGSRLGGSTAHGVEHRRRDRRKNRGAAGGGSGEGLAPPQSTRGAS